MGGMDGDGNTTQKMTDAYLRPRRVNPLPRSKGLSGAETISTLLANIRLAGSTSTLRGCLAGLRIYASCLGWCGAPLTL